MDYSHRSADKMAYYRGGRGAIQRTPIFTSCFEPTPSLRSVNIAFVGLPSLLFRYHSFEFRIDPLLSLSTLPLNPIRCMGTLFHHFVVSCSQPGLNLIESTAWIDDRCNIGIIKVINSSALLVLSCSSKWYGKTVRFPHRSRIQLMRGARRCAYHQTRACYPRFVV